MPYITHNSAGDARRSAYAASHHPSAAPVHPRTPHWTTSSMPPTPASPPSSVAGWGSPAPATVTSYHTNALNLHSRATGLPLFTESPPSLSDLYSPPPPPASSRPASKPWNAADVVAAQASLAPRSHRSLSRARSTHSHAPSPHSYSSATRSGLHSVAGGAWAQDERGRVVYTGPEEVASTDVHGRPLPASGHSLNFSGHGELAHGAYRFTAPLPANAPPPPAPHMRGFIPLPQEGPQQQQQAWSSPPPPPPQHHPQVAPRAQARRLMRKRSKASLNAV